MSKIKKKLFSYQQNLWKPTNIFNVENTIKEIEALEPYVEIATQEKELLNG